MSFLAAIFPHLHTKLRFVCAVFAVFAVTAACSTTQPRHVWTQRALDAETAQVRGQLSVAEQQYHVLLPDAPSADKRRWLQLNLAELALQNGDEALARERFHELATTPPNDVWGANAALELCKIAPHDDDCYIDVVRSFPEEIASERALEVLVKSHEARAAYDALDALLMSLVEHEPVRRSEVADNVWFAAAQNRYEHLRDPNGALDAYRALHAAYTKGPLADDALWEMANIYRDHQQWAPALVLLNKLADEVESSWFIGSYESNWVDNAMYDQALIRMLFLDDLDGASDGFRRYIRRYDVGVKTDDAVWHLAQIERLRGDDDAYRRALVRFAEQFPESRWVRRIPPEILEATR